MKYLFVSAVLALTLASCGGGCDYSSAAGAADCACGMTPKIQEAITSGDEAKMKEIETELNTWETEVEKHIAAGDYTENDVEAELEKKNCDM